MLDSVLLRHQILALTHTSGRSGVGGWNNAALSAQDF